MLCILPPPPSIPGIPGPPPARGPVHPPPGKMRSALEGGGGWTVPLAGRSLDSGLHHTDPHPASPTPLSPVRPPPVLRAPLSPPQPRNHGLAAIMGATTPPGTPLIPERDRRGLHHPGIRGALNLPPASPTLPSPTWGGSRAPEDPASPLRPPQITISLQIANPSSPHNGSCRDGGLGRITIFCLATAARRPLIGGIRAWEGAASVRCNRDRNISV